MMSVFSYIPRNYKWITFTIVQRLFIVDLSLKNLHEDRNYDESWLSPSSCSVDAVSGFQWLVDNNAHKVHPKTLASRFLHPLVLPYREHISQSFLAITLSN